VIDDLRYALRGLAQSHLFTAVATISPALGIGIGPLDALRAE
jgi:hypothetical protein